ncbi:host attachment protein [Dyella sp.]|uniref:host attachment protein n=1 Tax=Dyella sp. TaxID=1869338 RepID=UPI002ED37F93
MVADASNARIFATVEDDAGLTEVIYFSRPHDKHGTKKKSMNTDRMQDQAVDYFAGVIAHALRAGLESRQFDRIVLVAPQNFLDRLNLHLDSRVFDVVVGEVPHDLVNLSAKALLERLNRSLPDHVVMGGS